MTDAATTSTATTETTATKKLTIRCQFCEAWNRIDASRAGDRPKCGKCGKPMLLDRPLTLTDETFSRTIAESEIPVLIDFYADWCAPCKMMAPYVDELAAKYMGRALVAKLDTDHSPQTARAHQIQGIPTVMVFDGGQLVARQSGAVKLPQLEALLAKAPTL